MAESIGAKLLRDPMWRLLLITCTLSSCLGFIDFRVHWLDSYWIVFNSVILLFFSLGCLDFPKKNLQISGLELINCCQQSCSSPGENRTCFNIQCVNIHLCSLNSTIFSMIPTFSTGPDSVQSRNPFFSLQSCLI